MKAAILDVTYKVDGKGTEVLLLCKTKSGKIVLKDRYDPYFLIKTVPSMKETIEKYEEIKVKKVEEIVKKIDGKETKLFKVIVNEPSDVPKLKEVFKVSGEIFEADILFGRRYLVDKELVPLRYVEFDVDSENNIKKIIERTEETAELDVLALDIETYGKVFSEKNPILMIAIYGKEKKVYSWKEIEGCEKVEDEKELILKIKEEIKRLNPDVITGYYSDGFDLPYIKKRAEILGVEFNEIKLRGNNEVEAKYDGCVHIDLLKLVRKTVGRNLETNNYALNDVANEILGEEKHDVDLMELTDAWDEDNLDKLKEFADYNLQDAKLTYELFEKLFPQLIEMTGIIGLAPHDVSRMAFSQLVEWFIIKQTPKYNEIIPNKPTNEELFSRKSARMQGAFVFEPTPGLYKNIAVFDFMSLYPTIISSHNLSRSSLRKGKKEEGFVNPDEDSIWFSKEKGFTSEILEKIVEKRLELKKENKKKPNKFLEARIGTLKLLANSFYGYQAFYAARWYCFEAGETTTAFARFYIKQVIKRMGEEKFDVLYSDTDSVFVGVKEELERAKKVAENINEKLPGLMELEFEGFFEAGIFVGMKGKEGGAKKRYALIDKDGKMKITGFEFVRRNVSTIAKEVQEKVLRIILEENDKKKALKFVQDYVEKLKNKEIDKEKLVIVTKLSKPLDNYDAVGPHVAIALQRKQKGEEIGRGTVIKYIISEGEGRIRDKAKIPEDIKNGDYDAEYYINNQVLPAVETIFSAVGYEKEDVMKEAKQKDLSSFFG